MEPVPIVYTFEEYPEADLRSINKTIMVKIIINISILMVKTF
jgi:hypothetical protein